MKHVIVLQTEIFREGNLYVGVCPDLNVSSFGETIEEARNALRKAVEVFLERNCSASLPRITRIALNFEKSIRGHS